MVWWVLNYSLQHYSPKFMLPFSADTRTFSKDNSLNDYTTMSYYGYDILLFSRYHSSLTVRCTAIFIAWVWKISVDTLRSRHFRGSLVSLRHIACLFCISCMCPWHSSLTVASCVAVFLKVRVGHDCCPVNFLANKLLPVADSYSCICCCEDSG